MDKKNWKEIIFWSHLLYPIIFNELEGSSISSYFRELSQKEIVFPNGQKKKPGLSTLWQKLKIFREQGFEAFLKKPRNDCGKSRVIPQEIIEKAIEINKKSPKLKIIEIARVLQKENNIKIARSTFFRQFSKIFQAEKEKKKNEKLQEKLTIEQAQHAIHFSMIENTPFHEILNSLLQHGKPNKSEIIPLNKEQLTQLVQWWQIGDYNKWKKGMAIEMTNVGIEIKKILEILKLAESTYFATLSIYKKHGFAKVFERKPRIDLALIKSRIIELLHASPRVYGHNRTSWTNDLLQEEYKKRYKKGISWDTLKKALKSAGYSIKKAKRVLTSSDPEYREKVDLLLKTLRSLKEDEILFFIDELGPMKVKKYGGRSYTKKGYRKIYPQQQPAKGSLTLSGALGAINNQITWFFHESKDSFAMIHLIEILFNQYYHMRNLYITWDGASWHDSEILVEWLNAMNKETKKRGEGPLIYLIPLPSNAQFLDVIEAVFSGLKRAIIHNSNYQSKQEMIEAISQYFQERNEHFKNNPKRAGNKIWQIDFFNNYEVLRSGDYREW